LEGLKVKKILLVVLVISLVFVSMPAFAVETLNITINGEAVDIPAEYGAVMIYNNRTMVPVRFVSEYLNFTLDWLESDQLVLFANQNHAIVFRIGSSVLLADFGTRTIQMDAPAMMYENRSYIPIRFFAESIGMTVTWDEDTQTVGLRT
jgi:hypothetical protein